MVELDEIEFGLRANNASRRDGLWAPPANKQTQSIPIQQSNSQLAQFFLAAVNSSLIEKRSELMERIEEEQARNQAAPLRGKPTTQPTKLTPSAIAEFGGCVGGGVQCCSLFGGLCCSLIHQLC